MCLLNADPRGVTIGRVEGRTTLAGSVPCESRSCPNCGPRIAVAHRDDIATVVSRAQGQGWSVRFLTLTLRHSDADSLADLLDALLACWRGMTKGRAWDETKKRHGIAGLVRVVECKHAHRNGWHPHLHVLLFIHPAAAATVGDLFVEVLTRWKTVTRAAGYEASTLAQDMREVGDEHVDRIAGYLTKELDIATEMTAGALKSSGESRTPLGLLVAAAAGDREAARLFREYESATFGRRLYASASAALRAVLAAGPAPVEHEAAQEPTPVARERLARVSRGSYESLSRVRGLRGRIAEVVEDERTDSDALIWWLRGQGIHASRPGPEAERVDEAPAFDGEAPF